MILFFIFCLLPRKLIHFLVQISNQIVVLLIMSFQKQIIIMLRLLFLNLTLLDVMLPKTLLFISFFSLQKRKEKVLKKTEHPKNWGQKLFGPMLTSIMQVIIARLKQIQWFINCCTSIIYAIAKREAKASPPIRGSI
jgi:hypothetical protein